MLEKNDRVDERRRQIQMQQSIQRMAGQIQEMQEEVRQLAQLAQQLFQQNQNHFQTLQGIPYTQQSTYRISSNEQASAMMLMHITEVCKEMNNHLRNISQHLSRTGTTDATTAQAGPPRSAAQAGPIGQGMRPEAPEGPINQDTTHLYNYNQQQSPFGQVKRMTSEVGHGGTSSGIHFVDMSPQERDALQSATLQNASMQNANMQMPAVNMPLPNRKASQDASTMSAPMPGSEDDLKNNLNEYREEPQATHYPYNRYTT
jgi:hypothetical protein